MKAFLKIPYEWVQKSGQGLTATEALVLADIQYWEKQSTLAERSERLGLSIEGLRKALSKLQEKGFEIPQSRKYISTKLKNEFQQSGNLNFNKVEKNTNKVENLKEKKEISPTPPIKNKKEECKKNIEEHYLSDATAPTGKNEEQKVYSLQHRCRLFFEQIYSQKKGAEYWYEGKDAAALKNILKKIRFLMPDEEKDNEEKLEYNFQYFVNAICTSPHTSAWVMDNFSLPTINSKFNEIYSQLKNGTAKQYRQQSGITDDQIRSIAERVAENGGLAF
jgi:hypothetical protein